jgi:hypothetical protein
MLTNINKVIACYLSAKSMIKTSSNEEKRNYARKELLRHENELYILLDQEQDQERSRFIHSILNN